MNQDTRATCRNGRETDVMPCTLNELRRSFSRLGGTVGEMTSPSSLLGMLVMVAASGALESPGPFSGTATYMSDPKKRQSVSWAPDDSLDRSQETKSVDSFDKNGEFVSWSPYMSIFGPQETSCRSKHVQSTALVVFPGTQETTLGPQETTAGITAAPPWERRRIFALVPSASI